MSRFRNIGAQRSSCAITYERIDGGAQEAPPPVNVAQVRGNEPLAIPADIRIGSAAAHLRATLCRCGESQNKPYCDGTHKKIGFKAG